MSTALTVIVGDVHGCAGELEELLARVQFDERRDDLVLVGDLLARGPDSAGVLALTRRLHARAVRGNHEEKLLAWRRHGRPLPSEHQHVVATLGEEDWRQLEGLPLWLDLPAHGARVVHGGVVPGTPVDRSPPEALLKIRTLDASGRWSDEASGRLWGEAYVGPPHVVFGHHARREPQLWPWATGIDTGCVYGGRLTAVVLSEGEPMPRGAAAATLLRSVPARRAYVTSRPGILER